MNLNGLFSRVFMLLLKYNLHENKTKSCYWGRQNEHCNSLLPHLSRDSSKVSCALGGALGSDWILEVGHVIYNSGLSSDELVAKSDVKHRVWWEELSHWRFLSLLFPLSLWIPTALPSAGFSFLWSSAIPPYLELVDYGTSKICEPINPLLL